MCGQLGILARAVNVAHARAEHSHVSFRQYIPYARARADAATSARATASRLAHDDTASRMMASGTWDSSSSARRKRSERSDLVPSRPI